MTQSLHLWVYRLVYMYMYMYVGTVHVHYIIILDETL